MPVLWTNEEEKRAIMRGEKPLPPQHVDMPIGYSITIIIVCLFCLLCRIVIGF